MVKALTHDTQPWHGVDAPRTVSVAATGFGTAAVSRMATDRPKADTRAVLTIARRRPPEPSP